MRFAPSFLTLIAFAMSFPVLAGEKADIDTSPRVFSSESGKYWVRVTTKRGRDNTWATTMALSHAEGGRTGHAEDKVIAEFTLDVFPGRVLLNEFGDMVTLSHFDSVGGQGVLTTYGRDGKKRGSTEHMEFLMSLEGGGSGSPRQIARERLVSGKGAEFTHSAKDEFLIIPLAEGKVAKLSLRTGRPVE